MYSSPPSPTTPTRRIVSSSGTRTPSSSLRPVSPLGSPVTPQPPPLQKSNSSGPPLPPSSPPPNKTRARDLLRKHYGLGVGPPVPSGKPVDPMDLDSSAFDARSYYEQLITTCSLPMLLKRENELLVEIGDLDGERQRLVYNHHHELIAASDTISAVSFYLSLIMRGNIDLSEVDEDART